MSISQNFPEEGPTLNLNFAGSKVLDPRITFSRSNDQGDATYMDANGLIVTAAADEPRFDHRYVNGEVESLGLLIEEQRQNLVTYSEEFEDTSWLRNNYNVSTNAITAPDGTVTADKIIAVNSNTYHDIYKTPGLSSGTYTFSVFAKAAEQSFIRLRIDTSTVSRIAVFNISNGTLSSSTNVTSSPIVSYPNGWYRCSITITADIINAVINGFPTSSAGNYSGDGTSGIYIWGAQLEAGAFPTSYIPTSSSQATRSPDEVSMTGTNFSDWFNSSEGTIVVDSLVEYNPEATKFVYGISGGSYDLNLRQPHLTGGKFRAVIGGTFSSAPGTGGNAVNGSTTKAAVAYTSSTGRLQVGDSGVDVTPGGAVDGNQLSIGAHNGRIKQLTYYPTRLSNTVLQTLTK